MFDLMDLGFVVFSFNRPTNRVLAGIRAEFNEIQAQRAKTVASRPCPVKAKKSLVPTWH